MYKVLLLILSQLLNTSIFNNSILPDSSCVTKITAAQSAVNEIKYNKQNRPVEIKYKKFNDQFTTTIAYKNGKISQITGDYSFGKFISDVVFLTDNKVLITKHLKDGDMEYLLEFRNNLLIRKRKELKNFPDSISESLYYYDSNDNLLKREIYDGNTLFMTFEYSDYDNQKNFYYTAPIDWEIISELHTINYGTLQIPISKNNPLSYKTTFHDTFSGQVRSYDDHFVYQYNNKSYMIAARPANVPEFDTFITYKK